MSEPTELLLLAELLYDAFKDRGGLNWMPPFKDMSLARRENWMRVSRAAIKNRWLRFSDEEVTAISWLYAFGSLQKEALSELTRRVAEKQERET